MLAIFPFPYVLNALAVLTQAAVARGRAGPVPHPDSRPPPAVVPHRPRAGAGTARSCRARPLPAVDLRRGRQPARSGSTDQMPGGTSRSSSRSSSSASFCPRVASPCSLQALHVRSITPASAEPAGVLLDRRRSRQRCQPAWSRKSWCSASSSGGSSSWACGRRSSSPSRWSSGSRITSTTAGACCRSSPGRLASVLVYRRYRRLGPFIVVHCALGSRDCYSCLSLQWSAVGRRGAAVGAVDFRGLAACGANRIERRPPAPQSSPQWSGRVACTGMPSVRSGSQSSWGVGGLPRLGRIEYRLMRESIVKEYRRGRLGRLDVCDAQPELAASRAEPRPADRHRVPDLRAGAARPRDLRIRSWPSSERAAGCRPARALQDGPSQLPT